MLLSFGFLNAQCKVYSGRGTYGGTQVGYIDGGKVYSGRGTYGGTQVGYIDGGKVYSGRGTYGGTQVGYGDGCGNASMSAALLLLL